MQEGFESLPALYLGVPREILLAENEEFRIRD